MISHIGSFASESKQTQANDLADIVDIPIREEPSGKKRKTKKDLNLNEVKEMKTLESFLFGTLYSPPEFGKEYAEGDPSEKQVKETPLFVEDKFADDEIVVYEDELPSVIDKDEKCDQERKPVWVDDEEEKIEVDITKVPRLRKLRKAAGESVISGSDYIARLRAQHAKLNPFTDWARSSRKVDCQTDSDGDSDKEKGAGDLLRSSDDLVVKGFGGKLLPGLLEYSKLMDANGEEPSNAPINAVQFHCNGQLLLTAGRDRRLRFFQIDGKRNTKVQSIFFEDCPVHQALFLPDGSQVVLTGRRRFFYIFDLVKAAVDKIGPLTGRDEKALEVFDISPDSSTIAFAGDDGYILLVSLKTKELVGTLKMNGTARCLTFTENGTQLLSGGGDGDVYHWDLRARRCIHRARDEGCLIGTAIGASPDGGSLFAAGSSSGIVNLYNRSEFLGGKRKPLKTIENLTTQVDKVQFSPDGQILAIISRMNKNTMKLIHVPSFHVFSNWPPPRYSMQYPRCFDFSPGGGFMAVGNVAGKVLLYKLHHYQRA